MNDFRFRDSDYLHSDDSIRYAHEYLRQRQYDTGPTDKGYKLLIHLLGCLVDREGGRIELTDEEMERVVNGKLEIERNWASMTYIITAEQPVITVDAEEDVCYKEIEP